MPEAPRVSVIMPAYNAGQWIAATLDSLLAQTFTDFEILVGDDGSKDDTAAIVASLAQRDARIQLHHLGHKGAYAARNAMLEKARGHYVMFHDADDLSLPHRMAEQVAFLDSHSEFAAVSCNVIKFSSQPPDVAAHVSTAKAFAEERYELRPFHYSKRNFPFPASMMRADALRKTGGFRPCFDFAEDADFIFRLEETGRLARLEQPLFLYRQHANNTARRAPYRQTESSVLSRVVARQRRKGWPDTLFNKQKTFLRIFSSGLPPLAIAETLWLLATRYAYRRIKNSAASG
jgi:glycosyltransferase involved in cell wall biosynthesis